MTSTNVPQVITSNLNFSLLFKNGRRIFLTLFALFSISAASFAQVQCKLAASVIPSSIVYPSVAGMHGAFAIQVTGGTGPYMVTVNDMHMNVIQPTVTKTTNPFVIMDLAAGYYWVDIVDANGCKTFVDVDLGFHPCTFVANYSNVKPATNGLNNGSFQVNVVDGTAPFTVTVYDMHMNLVIPVLTFNSAPFTISGLPSNYYWVGIQDSKGCYGFVDVDLQCYQNCGPVRICTYTQGYYGNPGGNNSHLNLLNTILSANGGQIMVGSNGHTVKATTAQQIIDFLPGGGPSAVLAVGNGTLGTAPYTGTSNNSLLSQTLTLALNLGIPGTTLGGVNLNGFASSAVINAVVASGNSATVAGLLAFANSALGGGSLFGVALSNISDAATSVNEYFDECRLFSGVVVAVSPRSVDSDTKDVDAKADVVVSSSPNPFQSTIHFVITSKVSGRGELSLYNLAGAKVAVPFSGNVSAGQAQTVDYSVPSTMRGGLFYMMKVGSKSASGKLVSAAH